MTTWGLGVLRCGNVLPARRANISAEIANLAVLVELREGGVACNVLSHVEGIEMCQSLATSRDRGRNGIVAGVFGHSVGQKSIKSACKAR